MTVCNAELIFRDVLLRDMLTVPIQDIERDDASHHQAFCPHRCKLTKPTMLLQISFANTA